MTKSSREILDYYQSQYPRRYVCPETVGLALKIWAILEKYSKSLMIEPNLNYNSLGNVIFSWRHYVQGDNRDFLELEISQEGILQTYYNGTQGISNTDKNLREIENLNMTTLFSRRVRDLLPFFYQEIENEKPTDAS